VDGYGIEAELDIEFIMGMAPGVATAFWEWPNDDFCGDLHNYTAHMLTQDTPNVNSISYGWQGPLSELGCVQQDVNIANNNFAKLAGIGVSIMISSGDSGAGNPPESDVTAQTLWPSWPASSPWVTAVGATRFVNQKVGQPEMASDQFGSGGGFSTQFNASTYQAAAVAAYLKQSSTLPKFPPLSQIPTGGRATPDIAGLGEGYQVYTEGQVESVGGTSCSSPMFAGLVSLINDARIQAGKPTMGFLNPFLYQCTGCFFDVVQGSNAIDRNGLPQTYGYAAATGWDAATGLGTPHFDKLLAAAQAAVENRDYTKPYVRQ
jgi:tripeptidyl-peptidase-1